MINFRDHSYARIIVRTEQAMNSFRNQPSGVQSTDMFGGEAAMMLAATTNLDDVETDKLADQPWQWLQQAVPGNLNWKTGERERTEPSATRQVMILNLLYREGWLLPSDWLPHLIDMAKAVEFAEKNGIAPYASQTVIGGRIFGDAICEYITKHRAELVILQWTQICRERFIRVRRFTLIIERQPFESENDFMDRVEKLDTDYGMMEDQLGNLGSDWGEIWVTQKGVVPTTISNYDWQFARKNRILGFTETDHAGNARRFEFPRKPDQIARMHAVQAKVDEIERFQEAAE